MSAWLVNPAHVAAIVRYAARQKYMTDLRADPDAQVATANMLHAENAASVNYRYPGHEAQEPHRFTEREIDRARALTPVELLKAIHCLDYQSCDHPGWKDSAACKFLLHLTHNAIADLPGYDAAPWGID